MPEQACGVLTYTYLVPGTARRIKNRSNTSSLIAPLRIRARPMSASTAPEEAERIKHGNAMLPTEGTTTPGMKLPRAICTYRLQLLFVDPYPMEQHPHSEPQQCGRAGDHVVLPPQG